jgi:predicted nucleotidyltransferase
MQDLMDRFVAWASEQPNIRGGTVLGSHARTQTPADTLSDLDLAVVVQDPRVYLSDVAWLRTFGEPRLTFL